VSHTPQTKVITCDQCGHQMVARQCSYKCEHCGYKLTCSDNNA